MKITLNIKDSLLADAKALAVQQQTSLSRLIEEGLQLRLRAPLSHSEKTKQQIHIYKGRGGLGPHLNRLATKQCWISLKKIFDMHEVPLLRHVPKMSAGPSKF